MQLLRIGRDGNEDLSKDDNDDTELEQKSERCKNRQTNLPGKCHARRPQHTYAKEQSTGEDQTEERYVKRPRQIESKMKSVGDEE